MNTPNFQTPSEYEIIEENTPVQQPKRDIWLTILLCLSFVWGLIQGFSNLSMFALYDMMKVFINENLPESLRYMQDQFELIFSTNRIYFLFIAIAYALSIAGVIFMWNLRKIGFHFYVIAQLACLLLGVFFLGVQHVSMGELMLTILFIIFYVTRLKLFR